MLPQVGFPLHETEDAAQNERRRKRKKERIPRNPQARCITFPFEERMSPALPERDWPRGPIFLRRVASLAGWRLVRENKEDAACRNVCDGIAERVTSVDGRRSEFPDHGVSGVVHQMGFAGGVAVHQANFAR